ncbi:MAG: hypothetical protein WBG02_10995 [Candidatus Acidiferrum sp.]
MTKLKRITGFAFAPFLIGMIGLFNLMERPRFASIHTVDVVQLLASGACFGVAFAGVIATLRSERPA